MNPVEKIDWKGIFEEPKFRQYRKGRKFERPVETPELTLDFDQNINIIAEWLVRNGKPAEIRNRNTPCLNIIGKMWYLQDHQQGTYLHVCYPKDLIKFYNQYKSIYTQYNNISPVNMSIDRLHYLDNLKELSWSQWNCVGFAGERLYGISTVEWLDSEDLFGKAPELKELPKIDKYTCSRCCTEMPRGLKTFIKLSNKKLQGLK
jgi:hypothetical protein